MLIGCSESGHVIIKHLLLFSFLSPSGGDGNQQHDLRTGGWLRQVHQGGLRPSATNPRGHKGHHQAAKRSRALQDLHQRPASQTGGQV